MAISGNYKHLCEKKIPAKKKWFGNNYGGFIINISKPQISSYNLIHNELPNNLVLQTTRYCSGRFYFLSQYAVTNLLSKKIKLKKNIWKTMRLDITWI